MDIKVNNSTPVFSSKFVQNNAFLEVVKCAEKSNMLPQLDNALHFISKVEGNDILLMQGKNADGKIISNMTSGKRSIFNLSLAGDTPEMTSLRAIIELAQIGSKKFAKLFGKEPKINVNAENIIEKYSTKI